MTKEEAAHLSEVLKAYSEGKTIQVSYIDGEWIDATEKETFHLHPNYYRIKKEPVYRPYNSAKEFLQAQKEHGPYLIRSTTRIPEYSNCFVLSDNESVRIAFSNEKSNIGFTRYTFELLYSMSIIYKHMMWQDGSPCGIMEE